MTLLLRAWYRSLLHLLNFITRSDVCGTVTDYWGTFEFQPKRGNLPHFHLILYCRDTPHDLAKKIVCKNRRLWSASEEIVAQDPQIIDESTDLHDLASRFAKLQTHSCEKASYLCQKKVDNHGRPICRVTRYPLNTPLESEEVEIPQTHSDNTWKLLTEMGNAKEVAGGYAQFYVAIGPQMRTKWNYPVDFAECVVPTIAFIFMATLSTSNVQVMNPRMTACYTSTYLAFKEMARVTVAAGSSPSSVTARVGQVEHDKLPGVRARLRREDEERRFSSAQEARLISAPEGAFHLLDMQYIHTSFTFVHVSTMPAEFRSSQYRRGPAVSVTTLIQERQTFPVYRQFTADQIDTMRDAEASGLREDKITVFSCRPPELMFVDTPQMYFSMLTTKKERYTLTLNVTSDPWVDGRGHVVRLYPSCRADFENLLVTLDDPQQDMAVRVCVRDILHNFATGSTLHISQSPEHATMRPPIVVFSTVSPTSAMKFASHIVLSLGRFQTEHSLFKHRDLRHAFMEAGLTTSLTPPRSELLLILKRYLVEDLMLQPGGLRKEDSQLQAAHDLLQEILQTGNLLHFGCPAVFQSSIQAQTTEKCRQYANSNRLCLVDTLIAAMEGTCALPTRQQLMSATTANPQTWTPVFAVSAQVNAASVAEQQRAFHHACAAVDTHMRGQANFVHFQAFLGPPGVGKTFLTSASILYALSQGANVATTSLSSEQASRAGGIYVAHLFHLPVTRNNVPIDVARTVDSAMDRLECDVEKLWLLRSLHILGIEELGMLSAELFHVIDKLLQKVRRCSLPFGGILVIANGDPLQLPPPSGRPIWMSAFIILLFDFHYMEHFVRMADPEGQELLSLIKHRPMTDVAADRAVVIIAANCLFPSSFDQVPHTVLRVLGTRAGEKREAENHRRHILASGVHSEEHVSTDQSRHLGVWQDGANLAGRLERLVQEPQMLMLYEGALLRFTACNYIKRQWQGQLCILRTMPAAARAPFTVWAAPPGVRTTPTPHPVTGLVDYVAAGFYATSVTFRQGHEHRIGSVFYRRNQYSVKNFVAATVHKVMGDTLPGIATKVIIISL